MPNAPGTKRLIAFLLASSLLAGCSSGSAPEARQGQEADKQRTSVVTDMQATHTWEMINSTPEGTPASEP